jgi:hypothetical protein
MGTRQTCTFDFADPRMLRGEDARIDRKATQMGIAGPASPTPKSAPTASEIRSAKAEAIGGGRKRCTKGKNCSATCIAQGDDCLVEFPEPVQNEIRKMVGYLMKKGDIEEGSQRDVELGKAAILAGQHLTKESASGQDKIFGTSAPGQSRLLTALEIADLKANRNKLGDSEFDEKVRQAFQKDVFSRGVKLDRKDLETVYESLPQSAKLQLNNSGNPGKGKWYGTDKDGNEVTTGNNGTKSRGLQVLDMYFRQGGTDAYGKSNRVLSPADFDVEHIRPVSKGGLDHPSNWVLARSGAQRQRADSELKKWIDSLPDPKDRTALRAYYDSAAKKGRAKGALKATLASMDPKKMSDADLLKISPSNMKYLFNRDSFFVSGLYGMGAGGRLTNTQPAVFGRAYGLARKYLSEDDVAAIRSDVKKVWNKDWMENGGSTRDMVRDYIKIYKNRLPAESFKLLEPEIVKWGAKILQDYPEKSPRAQ